MIYGTGTNQKATFCDKAERCKSVENQTLKNVFKYNKKAFLIQKNCPYITLVRHRTLI